MSRRTGDCEGQWASRRPRWLVPGGCLLRVGVRSFVGVAVVAGRGGCRRGPRAAGFAGFAGVGRVRGRPRRRIAGGDGGCLRAAARVPVCRGLGDASRGRIGLLAAEILLFCDSISFCTDIE